MKDEYEARWRSYPGGPARNAIHDRVRESTRDLAEVYADLLGDSRELSLALTALEEASMWANKGIARTAVVGL